MNIREWIFGLRKMTIELTITIQDDEGKRLSQPFLFYEPLTLDPQQPLIDKNINECVKILLDEFKGNTDIIKINAKMSIA